MASKLQLAPNRLRGLSSSAALSACGLALLGLFTMACGDNASARSPASATVPSGSAATPAFVRSAAAAEAASAAPSSAPSTDASADPAASASADVGEGGAAPTPAASAVPDGELPDGELPDVEVHNIGMHIGGEPNTAAQKRPIRNAVGKHYDDMRRCYAMAEKPGKETTFGVDMRIGRKGGIAKITNPRSGFKSSEVKKCLVEVFEKVEFPVAKKRIPMMVSFSVRFRRK